MSFISLINAFCPRLVLLQRISGGAQTRRAAGRARSSGAGSDLGIGQAFLDLTGVSICLQLTVAQAELLIDQALRFAEEYLGKPFARKTTLAYTYVRSR